MTTRTPLVIGVVCFVGILCFACVPKSVTKNEDPRKSFLESTQIAFRYQAFDAREETFARFTCVGTRLADRWAITASHCLNGSEKSVTILCMSQNGESNVETYHIQSQITHVTHDVSLLLFERDLDCLNESVHIARVVPEEISFFGSTIHNQRLDGKYNSIDQSMVRFIEANRDDHTIRLYDRDVCLAEGDSGYPVFVKGLDQRYELAGLLISGISGCPTIQTIVRTDRLASWVDMNISPK